MTQQEFAEEIRLILVAAIPQYGLDKIAQWAEVLEFCEERANTLAMSIPAMLTEGNI